MRAFLATYDKTGVTELGRGLAELGWSLVATTGTKRALEEAGLAAAHVSELTGLPDLFDGRVKTFHPSVFGGLLYRRGHAGDEAEVARRGIPSIDLVAVDVTPFAATAERAGATEADVLQHVDIGGPAMIRAAAKNHPSVLVIVDAADFGPVLAALRDAGGEPARVPASLRRRLAAKAFERTAEYDVALARYLSG